jgi:uncharacterized protein involved in exopolysaccharide biosynthesis
MNAKVNHMNNPVNQSANAIIEDEISIKDIIDFIAESWRITLTSGVIGLLLAIGYLWMTPSKWEATAQIQMAQIRTSSNLNQAAVNIEDPNLLISRLKIPTSYDESIIQSCGLQNQPKAADILANTIKITPVKGLPSIVEIKLHLYSQENAKSCVESIYQWIKKSQEKIAAPLIEDAQARLDEDIQRLLKVKGLIGRADISGGALSIAYFVARDEIKYLTDEIMNLKAVIASGETHQAKLAAPVYVADQSIFPKKNLSSLAGIFAGLFFGFLLALSLKLLAKYRNKNLQPTISSN